MPTPTTDFTIFDGQQLITYTPQGEAAVENVPAVQRPLTHSSGRRIEQFVTLQATDVVLHIDTALLSAATLQANDTITLDGSAYNVLFVERQALENTAILVGRKV